MCSNTELTLLLLMCDQPRERVLQGMGIPFSRSNVQGDISRFVKTSDDSIQN